MAEAYTKFVWHSDRYCAANPSKRVLYQLEDGLIARASLVTDTPDLFSECKWPDIKLLGRGRFMPSQEFHSRHGELRFHESYFSPGMTGIVPAETISLGLDYGHLDRGAEAEAEAEDSITIFHLNVNDDRRPWVGGPYEHVYGHLRFKNRFEAIMKRIRDVDADVVSLCEAGSDAVEQLSVALVALGYACDISAYCYNDRAFIYLMAVKNAKLEAVKLAHVFFTKTGAPMHSTLRSMPREWVMEHNLHTEYEKSMPVFLISEAGGGRRIAVVAQVHVGLANEHRIAASRIIRETLTLYAKGTGLPAYALGDWNPFDARDPFPGYLAEQFDALGAHWYSLWDLDSSESSTFHAYPFDVARFMSAEQREEEKRLLTRLGECVKGSAGGGPLDGEIESLRQAVRDLHASVAASTVVPPATIGVKEVFSHPRSTNPLDGPVMDFGIGYHPDGKFGTPPFSVVVPTEGDSDHDGILVTIPLPATSRAGAGV